MNSKTKRIVLKENEKKKKEFLKEQNTHKLQKRKKKKKGFTIQSKTRQILKTFMIDIQ